MIMISMITQIPVTYHMVCPELCGRLLALKRHIRHLNELAVKELKKKVGRSGLKGKRWHQLQCCVLLKLGWWMVWRWWMVRYGDSILGIIYAVYYMQYILYIIMNTDIYGNLVF